jgi:hypothetical protein
LLRKGQCITDSKPVTKNHLKESDKQAIFLNQEYQGEHAVARRADWLSINYKHQLFVDDDKARGQVLKV